MRIASHLPAAALIAAAALPWAASAGGADSQAEPPSSHARAAASWAGQPVDLTGTWQRYGFISRPGVDPRYAAPPEGKLILKPAYAKPYNARTKAEEASDAAGQPIAGPGVDCRPYGMPEMMSAIYPLEILQTPGQITIIEEAYRQVRYIYLNQKQIPIGDAEPEFWGHSVGHWEGDTLVVNTVGIKPEVRYSDVPHSDQMQIDERIRLISKDRAEDRITVTDPVYLAKPWNFTYEYEREPGYKMLEYVCEDNREYRDPKTGGQRVQLIGDSVGGQDGGAPAATGPNAKSSSTPGASRPH